MMQPMPPVPECAFQVQQLDARVGPRVVLHSINLCLPSRSWVSIVGPNGAGKSTLLKVLAGLLPPSTGHVQFLDRPLDDWPRRERARQLSWLGQNEASADDLSVYDVVMLGRLPHQPWLSPPSAADHAAVRAALDDTQAWDWPRRERARQLSWLGQNEASADDLSVYDVVMLGRLPHQPWLSPPSAADHAAVRAALDDTQAWDWRHRALGALSGGERQRVLLARALAVQAQVLLMDEPLANLDPPHQADWLRLVRTLVQRGHTVVSVLHEISLALHADHLLVLRDGRLQHFGPCADADTHRALEQVFDQRIAIHPLAGQWVALPRV